MEIRDDSVRVLESCVMGMLPFGAEYNRDMIITRVKVSFSVTINHNEYKFTCSSTLTHGDICNRIQMFMNEVSKLV